MRKTKMLVATAVCVFMLAGAAAWARPEVENETSPTQGKWLHIRVEDGTGDSAEVVKVNVPLSLAEAVIPAINVKEFQGGKINMEHAKAQFNGVDIRKLAEALRTAEDGKYVTVEGKDAVEVSKQGGFLIARVREDNGQGAKVDVKIPLEVVDALFREGTDEIDLGAAIKALAAHGDDVVVTVEDKGSKVRVWIDSENEPK